MQIYVFSVEFYNIEELSPLHLIFYYVLYCKLYIDVVNSTSYYQLPTAAPAVAALMLIEFQH